MSALYDEDGIDGPHDRAWERAMKEDARKARRRSLRKPPAWMVSGAIVNYHSVIGEPPTKLGLTVKGDPFKSAAGYWVVFVEGVSGYVCCEALSEWL